MNKHNFINKMKKEYLGRGFSKLCGYIIVVLTLFIIGFVAVKGTAIFVENGYSLREFLFSMNWNPEASTPQFGALVFVLGSTIVALGAVIISAPIGVALAVFMNLIAPRLGEKIVQPAMELFVGIPSVVYGWIGITVLIPMLKNNFGGIGFSLLAAILVLSIMILPTITSISSDAIRSIPKEYLEGSYGLGATRWQTIIKVVIPACKSGILTGVVLGVARAFGEALAVQMVIGNSIKAPKGLLDTTTTITSILTMDMSNTIFGTQWNNALWSLALLLLVISFIFIVIIRLIGKRSEM